MSGMREFFNSSSGKLAAIGLVLLALVLAFFSYRSSFGGDDAASISRDRMFVDAATGKPFEHQLQMGERIPVKAPSGGMTGYPAELCYWTKDGKRKKDPTPVLLNDSIGKHEPTFCPDCGRLV